GSWSWGPTGASGRCTCRRPARRGWGTRRSRTRSPRRSASPQHDRRVAAVCRGRLEILLDGSARLGNERDLDGRAHAQLVAYAQLVLDLDEVARLHDARAAAAELVRRVVRGADPVEDVLRLRRGRYEVRGVARAAAGVVEGRGPREVERVRA